MIESIINKKFSSDEFLKDMERALEVVWNNTSRYDFSLSSIDIDSLNEAHIGSLNLINNYFNKIITTANERKINLTTFNDIEFISVGEDCFSRLILTRWGFKKPAKLGEKTSPFDLAVHPIKSINQCLENNFQGYIEPSNLIFNNEWNIVQNKKYKITFNHEKGVEYAENNYKKIIDVYTRRIANFLMICKESRKVCFVLHLKKPELVNPNSLERLYSLLMEKCRNNSVKLICLCTLPYGKSVSHFQNEMHDKIRSKEIYFIYENYPNQEYIWHQHASTDDGFEFEHNIANKLKNLLISMEW